MSPETLQSDTPARSSRRQDRVLEALAAERHVTEEAAHQAVRRAEHVFLPIVAFYARVHAETRIARLRTLFDNAADPRSTPDPSEASLRALLRDLHPLDQTDDTARFECVDGPLTVEEEERCLRALYATMAKMTRVARCLEARKEARRA